jgi:pSer/pThr/pTyr-binding forkhead associated (FHA) protein
VEGRGGSERRGDGARAGRRGRRDRSRRAHLDRRRASEEPRRALLLYQEGTAEEQIYPFTGDTLTIGRGRDNDIQIKNDSKVSRFHCKLYRKGNNFYIEDNKSSNGSLVNGELITERRLFGGEELIIGETFFRFRIM